MTTTPQRLHSPDRSPPPIPRRKRQACSSRLRQRSQIPHQPQPSPHRLSHTGHTQRSVFSLGQPRSFTEIKGVRPHHHRATAGGGFDQVLSAQRRARRRRSSPRCWRRGCRSTASGATRAGRAVRSVPICWSARWRRPCAIAATFLQQRRKILPRVGVRHVRRKEFDSCRILKKQFPHPLAQHRPNQDIGIQDDGLGSAHATAGFGFLSDLAGLRTALNSATTSSTLTP